MKTTGRILAAMTMVIVMVAAAGAQEATGCLTPAQMARAEETLLQGICCDNDGAAWSSAYMLGELKSKKAVIPLMKMLKSCDCESGRVVAALSLCRIGDPRGLYAVKMAARFDENPVVRARAAWFYNEYVQAGTYAFQGSGSTTTNMATR